MTVNDVRDEIQALRDDQDLLGNLVGCQNVWLTKKAHWLIGKFLKDGLNHVAVVPGPIPNQTSWYVNGELVGRLGDEQDFFPFSMSPDWIEGLYNLENLCADNQP